MCGWTKTPISSFLTNISARTNFNCFIKDDPSITYVYYFLLQDDLEDLLYQYQLSYRYKLDLQK